MLKVCIHKSSMKHWVLVNMHNFSLLAQGDTFLDLLPLDKEKSKTQRPVVALKVNLCNRQHQSTIFCHSASLDRNHCIQNVQNLSPLLLMSVKCTDLQLNLITGKQCLGNAVGVTLNEMKLHVLSKFPKVAKKGTLDSTIHQLQYATRGMQSIIMLTLM